MAIFKEKLTTAGKNMYANMLAGNVQLHFTKIVMGDGTVAEASQASLTAVASPKVTLIEPFALVNGDNTITVYAIFDNTALASGFYFREKGLYASDGTKEILFAYGNNGSLAEWIDPPTTGLVEKKISTIISYSEGDSINITVKSEGFVPVNTAGNAGYIQFSDGTVLPDKISALNASLSGEITARQNADTTLSNNLNLIKTPLNGGAVGQILAKVTNGSYDYTWVDNLTDFSLYHVFCANVNANSLDAAFGKNNEDRVKGIGLQLAMYAWFKGDSKTTYPFTNLITCNTLLECLTNEAALKELVNNFNISELVRNSAYANAILDTYYKAYLLNKVNTTSDFSTIWGDAISLAQYVSHYADVTNAICQNKPALMYLYNNYATLEATLQGSALFLASADTYASSTTVAQSATYVPITTKKAFLRTVYWSAPTTGGRITYATVNVDGSTWSVSHTGGQTKTINEFYSSISVKADSVYGGNYTVKYLLCE